MQERRGREGEAQEPQQVPQQGQAEVGVRARLPGVRGREGRALPLRLRVRRAVVLLLTAQPVVCHC